MSPVKVTLLVNGRQAAKFMASPRQFRTYSFDLPAEFFDRPGLEVVLLPETWKPGGTDPRVLGVALDWVELSTLETQ